MDAGNAAVLGALAGAFAAILGAGLTGLLQIYLAGRNARAAREDADRQRRALAAKEERERRLELYLRWLRWQSTIHSEIVDAAITGRPFPRTCRASSHSSGPSFCSTAAPKCAPMPITCSTSGSTTRTATPS